MIDEHCYLIIDPYELYRFASQPGEYIDRICPIMLVTETDKYMESLV